MNWTNLKWPLANGGTLVILVPTMGSFATAIGDGTEGSIGSGCLLLRNRIEGRVLDRGKVPRDFAAGATYRTTEDIFGRRAHLASVKNSAL